MVARELDGLDLLLVVVAFVALDLLLLLFLADGERAVVALVVRVGLLRTALAGGGFIARCAARPQREALRSARALACYIWREIYGAPLGL